MIYQNDTYTFTLPLTRETTTVLGITGVTYNPSISPYAVYTFSLVSGPYPTLQNKIVITGMSHTGNNGTYTVVGLSELVDSLGLSVGGTFSVTNTGASTHTETGTGTVGTIPNVTVAPTIQIVRLADLTPILSLAANMLPTDSSNQLYIYVWNVGPALSGEYAAIVSYAADGNTFNGKFIEKVRVGDSRVIDIVALDATVAKDATVAQDITVAHASDIAAINPNTSSAILSIKSKTDNLPNDPTGMTLLGSILQDIIDIHDAILGSQTVDKTQNPAIYSLKRLDSSLLARYTLTDNIVETSRTKF